MTDPQAKRVVALGVALVVVLIVGIARTASLLDVLARRDVEPARGRRGLSTGSTECFRCAPARHQRRPLHDEKGWGGVRG